MRINNLKMFNLRITILLILFFIFLLFGFQVFAAVCNKPPAWNAESCTVNIYYEDPSGGSGLEECLWATEKGVPPLICPTDGAWNPACTTTCSGTSATCTVAISIGSTGDCDVNGEGACKICAKAVDRAGNEGYASTSLNIDYTAPATTIECNGEPCFAGWYNATTIITLSCSDGHSGCDKTYYCIDQTPAAPCAPATEYTGAFNLPTEGTNYVRYYSTDVAGNIEDTNSQIVKLDKTGPVSEFTTTTTPDAGSTVYSNFDVSVDDWDRPRGVAGIDNSDLAGCYYRVIDSGVGETQSGTSRNCNSDLSFTVTVGPGGDCRTVGGTCTVTVYAYDNAGNPGNGELRTFDIAIDDIPPIVSVIAEPPEVITTWQNTDATASVSCIDAESGCDPASYGLLTYDSDPTTCSATYTDYELVSSKTISSYQWACGAAKDIAGNEGFSTSSVEFKVDQRPPSTDFATPTTPDAGSWQGTNFAVKVEDSDDGGSGLKGGNGCKYIIADLNTGKTTGIKKRPCGEFEFTVPVGTGANDICEEDRTGPEIGQPTCSVETIAYDNAGNSTPKGRNFRIDYTPPIVGEVSPTTTIQRVEETFSASAKDEVSQISGCSFWVEGALAPDDVSYSEIPCADCIVSVDHTFNEARDYENVFFMCWDEVGNVNSGPPVTVTVNPLPTLSVDLYADPPSGDVALYDVDLIATVFGTMTGTINYEFYCDAAGSWTCKKNDIASTTYSLSQCILGTGGGGLCDYPSSGTYTAKVFIERGVGCGEVIECTNGEDCCQIRKVDIYVGENQPPTCGINVPGTTTVSTSIYIEVGSSFDPEGEMATVRFCSDKNPANPNNQCDELWTKRYDWNTPEGDWENATSLKMKWSFAATGSYEVWAEVKDSVGQPSSCYDKITVTECLPGDTMECDGGFGCIHTITCTPEGSWPDCPIDECTPGSTQDCGTNGTQTCTDSCTWGVCVEPGVCPWPPPSCPICQHPVCNTVTEEWECQPDPDGTDCGDCLLCISGSCSDPLCLGTPESCECIPGSPDSCRNCSTYGTECGYQGVCSCGLLETPIWSCLNGYCQCSCTSDPICEEPPPGCEEDYPGVAIIPSRQPGAAGTSLPYTVSVINNDFGQDCEDVTFDLTTGGICNETDWSCTELPNLTVSPGRSATTTLIVTSPSPYSRGDYEISVTATKQ